MSMRTEQEVRAAWDYYRDLTRRAHDYWNEHSTERNYVIYQEYMAKRDALAWMLGEGDAISASADYPVHTVFYPDYLADMQNKKGQ